MDLRAGWSKALYKIARLVKRLRAATTRKAKQVVSLLLLSGNDIEGEDATNCRVRTMVDRTTL
jgi:hypothetical protein